MQQPQQSLWRKQLSLWRKLFAPKLRTLHFLPTFRQLEADALLAEQEDRSHVRAAALDPPFDRPERLSDLASVAPPQVTPLHALWRMLDQHGQR